ncbi:MAG: phage tail protein [Tannerellaceae bacterium]|nr:phage tail protein [Tannerellaceae bacterium]
MMGIEVPFKEVSGLSVEMEQEMVVEGGLNTHVHRLPKQMKHANLVLKGALKPVNSIHVLWIKSILEGSLLLPIPPIPISVTLLMPKAVLLIIGCVQMLIRLNGT